MKNNIKSLLAIGLVSLLAGCKVGVIVPEGGNVQSTSSTRNCTENTNCFYQVTDTTFDETFTAVPNVGWQFVKWNSGSGFWCEDSTSLTCRVSTVGLGGVAGAEAVIASDTTYYIMPLFKFVGIDTDGDGIKDHIDEDDDNDGVIDTQDQCPLVGPNEDGLGCPFPDTDGDGVLDVNDICPLNPNPECDIDSLVVIGKEWTQPDLFRGTSSDSIAQICPDGICNGTLTGSYRELDSEGNWVTVEWAYNLTGWTWASASDVNELVNYYKGPAETFGCHEFEGVVGDGWRPWTAGGNWGFYWDILGGFTYSKPSEPSHTAIFYEILETGSCTAQIGAYDPSATVKASAGWFYRTP